MKVFLTTIIALAALTFFACGDNLLTSEAEDSDDTPNEDGKTTGINKCSFWSVGVKDDTTGLTWRVVNFKQETSVENDHVCTSGYTPTLADFKSALDAKFFDQPNCAAPVELSDDAGSPTPQVPPTAESPSSGVDENDQSTEPSDLADGSDSTSDDSTEPVNTTDGIVSSIRSDWQFCVETSEPETDGSGDDGADGSEITYASCCGKAGYTYIGQDCVESCLAPDCGDRFDAPQACLDLGTKTNTTPTGDYFAQHTGVCSDSEPQECGCSAGYVWDTSVESCTLDVDCDEATKRLNELIKQKHDGEDNLACTAVTECTTAKVGPGAFCPSPMNNGAKQRWDDLAASNEYKSLLGKYNMLCPVPEGLCAPDGELACTDSQCTLEFN